MLQTSNLAVLLIFLLFSFLVLTKCQALNLRWVGHVTGTAKGLFPSEVYFQLEYVNDQKQKKPDE